jgi:N6-adenosine-specific RNA methylase IME4
MTRYRTIVVDPPWAYPGGTGKHLGDTDHRRKPGAPSQGAPRVTGLPYASMTVERIAALPIPDLTAADAHLYLWTTNRYLMDAYSIAQGWGFEVSKPLIWCKEPMGFMGRPFTSSAEFILFCRRGSLKAQGDAGRQWWVWKRGAHSAKPEAFLDLVEQVSPGPRLEMFARRDRLGWDTWGYEALGTSGVAA